MRNILYKKCSISAQFMICVLMYLGKAVRGKKN